MKISLHAILSHQSFDWSCRTSKCNAALAKKMEEIVRAAPSRWTTAPSSPLFKAAIKIYNHVRKKKDVDL